jgi:predicted nucleic acid-binding Zn ribbon protein
MRRKDAQPLSAIIEELLKVQHLDGKLNEVRLIDSWEKVLGKNIAAYTGQKYIKNKILFVHVTSSVLRNELMMSREKLIESLNNAVGTVVITDIVFR